MENMNTALNTESLSQLRGLLNKCIYSFKYDKSLAVANSAFQRMGICHENGYLLIDNQVDWFDNYFAGEECIPFLTVSEVKTEEEIHFDKGCHEFLTIPVNDVVLDILLVQDELKITKNGVPYQDWNSTEAIIFVTNKRQYGFAKQTTWLDESLEIYKGQNVLSMLDSFHKHWNIFGEPFDATVKRYLMSLSTGESKLTDQTTEIGYKEPK